LVKSNASLIEIADEIVNFMTGIFSTVMGDLQMTTRIGALGHNPIQS
jgi:hypothetical protein